MESNSDSTRNYLNLILILIPAKKKPSGIDSDTDSGTNENTCFDYSVTDPESIPLKSKPVQLDLDWIGFRNYTFDGLWIGLD